MEINSTGQIQLMCTIKDNEIKLLIPAGTPADDALEACAAFGQAVTQMKAKAQEELGHESTNDTSEAEELSKES